MVAFIENYHDWLHIAVETLMVCGIVLGLSVLLLVIWRINDFTTALANKLRIAVAVLFALAMAIQVIVSSALGLIEATIMALIGFVLVVVMNFVVWRRKSPPP